MSFSLASNKHLAASVHRQSQLAHRPAQVSRPSHSRLAAPRPSLHFKHSLLTLHQASSSPQCSHRNIRMKAAAGSGTDAGQKKIGVLFVCLGNICRSPTAEAMFKAVVQSAGLEDRFDIDSCGTGGGNEDWYLRGGWSYHEGEESDERMTKIAKERGVLLTSRSRPLQPLDLKRFDYVIGMEHKNMKEMIKAINYWRDYNDIPEDYMDRLSLMTDYCAKYKANAVPDPYYAAEEGRNEREAFNLVLDLLEDASSGLLEHIKKEKKL